MEKVELRNIRELIIENLKKAEKEGLLKGKKIIIFGANKPMTDVLVYLKEHGYKVFDWSGIVLDPEDSRYSIGQFKLSFGGKVIDSLVLCSPIFKLLEYVRNIIR